MHETVSLFTRPIHCPVLGKDGVQSALRKGTAISAARPARLPTVSEARD
jgi:hypothetical protein